MSVLTKVATFATKTASRTLLKTKKYSPELLVGAGLLAMVGGTVLAIKATMKCEEVLDNRQKKIDMIEKAIVISRDGHENAVPYSDEDIKRDRLVVAVQTTVDFIKLYGPAFTCIVGGVVFILSGHNILRKRNAALAAAFKVVEEAFSKYRQRVVEDLGTDKDLEYRYGIKKVVEEIESVDENGKKVKTKIERQVLGGNDCSMYARLFDKKHSTQWSSEPTYNGAYIDFQQNHANDLLLSRGHVFLSEVYDILGFERTPESIVVGWVRGNGDNFIEFNRKDVYINDPTTPSGMARSILLDFNVDGVVYDLI